jgi:hypothetical protein
MRKAWIENGIIRDIAHAEPSEIYHPDIAVHYTVEVPDDAENGDTFIDGVLTKPVIVAPLPVEAVIVKITTLSPIAFKLRFTPQERVAIYASTSAMVKDFISILDDTRLKEIDLVLQSTIDAVGYLASLSLITQARASEILA